MHQIPTKKTYKLLKLDELEDNTYYKCALTDKKVFVRDAGLGDFAPYKAVTGIYYAKGKYRIAEYFDYMLYKG